MAFLDHDVGDPRPVVLLQADAGLPDGNQLRPGHLKHNGTNKEFYLIYLRLTCEDSGRVSKCFIAVLKY